jgi:hypothetical protein
VSVKLHAIIDGKQIDRAAIREWEERRQTKVAKKLGIVADSFESRRQALLKRKLELGHEELRRIFSTDLKVSGFVSRLLAKLSMGRRLYSICEIVVEQGSAEAFAAWFNDCTVNNCEALMIDSCPDHFIIATESDGRQVVMEITGGSPFTAEFAVDYEDTSSIATPPDPTFPFQIAGVARLADGLAIGGVRHQFRQEGEGFRARMTVEFPRGTVGHMIAQHRWHLATEFSNWIELSVS